jgi:porin
MKFRAAAALLGWLAASVCETPAKAQDATQGIAGNPGAVDVEPGSGALGQFLGFGPDSGIRLGGVVVSNANSLAVNGKDPGTASFNNLVVIGGDANLDKLAQIPGATLGAAVLRFDGQQTNQQFGAVTGYNSLPGAPPLDRTELYELWWRQSLFADTVVVRFGKLVPTYDFDNVVRPVPVQDPSLKIPAVSGLLYTPIFVNPTILGVLPGYYNSAYGVTFTLAPTKSWYLSLGSYDGNLADGVQTGLEFTPTFNSYRFQIGEFGAAWLLGSQGLPGAFAIGAWDQTGLLKANAQDGSPRTITQDGSQGVYMFASQRLWRRSPEGDGVSGFIQFGVNDSRTMVANRYFGLGLTAFGLVPGRPSDSFGAGLAWSGLNARLGSRRDEALFQAYDQIKVEDAFYIEPAVTLGPALGEKGAHDPALAFTLQTTILF